MLNRATRLLNLADERARFPRRHCSIMAAEPLNLNAVCNEYDKWRYNYPEVEAQRVKDDLIVSSIFRKFIFPLGSRQLPDQRIEL